VVIQVFDGLDEIVHAGRCGGRTALAQRGHRRSDIPQNRIRILCRHGASRGLAASRVCHPPVKSCEGYSHSTATLIGGMHRGPAVTQGAPGAARLSPARRLSMP
jgi:hypothetical protein